MVELVSMIVGALVGAGFSSGRELMTFFVSFGPKGFYGLAVMIILFGLCSYLAMSKIIIGFLSRAFERHISQKMGKNNGRFNEFGFMVRLGDDAGRFRNFGRTTMALAGKRWILVRFRRCIFAFMARGRRRFFEIEWLSFADFSRFISGYRVEAS